MNDQDAGISKSNCVGMSTKLGKVKSVERLIIKKQLNFGINDFEKNKNLTTDQDMVIDANDDSIFNHEEESGFKVSNSKTNREKVESMISFSKEYRDNRFIIEQHDQSHLGNMTSNRASNRGSNRRSREDRIRGMSKSNSSRSWISLSRRKLKEDEKRTFLGQVNSQVLNEKNVKKKVDKLNMTKIN
jgi:hypothetical protein